MSAKLNSKVSAKASSKANAKDTPVSKPINAKAQTAFSLIAFILAEIGKRAGSQYYKRAIQYHKKQQTPFPRKRNDEYRKALTKDEVDRVLRMHDAGNLPSANPQGQAMFDVYMTVHQSRKA